MKRMRTLLAAFTSVLLLGFGATANAQCQASFTFSVNGSTVTLTNTSTGVTMPTYLWNFGDNTSSYSQNPTHSYNTAGIYAICLTLWDSLNNCQSTYCDSVIVNNGCGLNATASAVNASACNLCDGSVSASATGGTPPYTYQWSNFTFNSTISNACIGTYNCTVTDANGCVDYVSATVSCPPGNCQAGFTYSVSGGAVTFTNTSTGASWPNYFWSYGDNSYGTGTNTTHSYNAPGVYVVCLTLSDSLNNCQSSFCDTITITTGCGMTASASTTSASACNACDGSASVTVNGGTPPYTYTWNNFMVSGPNPTNLCPGNYSGTVTDANGCQVTFTATVSCPPGNCQAGFTYTVNGGTVTFTNTTTGVTIPTYGWSFGDNTNAWTTNAVHSYNNSGWYIVCLTVWDSASWCQSSYCDSIYVSTGCGITTSFITTNASNCSTCDGTATFSVSGGTPPYTYVWSTGATTSTAGNLCPNSIYTVTATDANGCQVNGTIWVNCNQNNTNCSSNFGMAQDSLNPLQWYAYPAVTGNGPISYFWDFGDGNTSTQPYPSHTYAVAGQYTVCLSILTVDSCMATYCDSSSVHRFVPGNVHSSTLQMQYLNVINPLSGINTNTLNVSYLAPNPASDFIDLTLDRETTGSIRITNLLGSVVYEGQLEGRNAHINVSKLQNGYYNISINTDKGSVNRKVAVMH